MGGKKKIGYEAFTLDIVITFCIAAILFTSTTLIVFKASLVCAGFLQGTNPKPNYIFHTTICIFILSSAWMVSCSALSTVTDVARGGCLVCISLLVPRLSKLSSPFEKHRLGNVGISKEIYLCLAMKRELHVVHCLLFIPVIHF